MIDWMKVLTACGVKPATAALWVDAFTQEVQPVKFSRGTSEIDDFLAQVLHESARLERMEEGLYYKTPERICAVWPSRFPTTEVARPYVMNPRALANKVYGGRLGNNLENDGWLYRGSGPIQVTGRSNFAQLEKLTGIPFTADPDLLRKPGPAPLRACVLWWEGNVPDSVMGDMKKVRQAVNGPAALGLDDTTRLTLVAQRLLP